MRSVNAILIESAYGNIPSALYISIYVHIYIYIYIYIHRNAGLAMRAPNPPLSIACIWQR